MASDNASGRSGGVPVIVFTGPVGVGKSTVAGEASSLLRDANIRHALVDLDHVGECAPPPGDDPWNERLVHRNLACMWANFRDVGADRLLLCRILEARSLLRHICAAVPDADITVVRLRAPLSVLRERILAREAGARPELVSRSRKLSGRRPRTLPNRGPPAPTESIGLFHTSRFLP